MPGANQFIDQRRPTAQERAGGLFLLIRDTHRSQQPRRIERRQLLGVAPIVLDAIPARRGIDEGAITSQRISSVRKNRYRTKPQEEAS
jgi:hypothetical protein